MALISLAGARGAPGVTALAVALAHRLPDFTGRPALLVEADPDGGVVSARHAVGGPAGFTALAGAARLGLDPDDVLQHATSMASGVPVVAGHPAAEQVHAALRAGAANISRACARLAEHDVVADLGRLRPGSPARPFVTESACLVIVARPVAEHLVAVADRIASVRELAPLHLVLVGHSPYSAMEVRKVLDVDHVSIVAHDPRAVASDPGACGRRRSAWRSSIERLAATLTEFAGLVPGADELSAADELDGVDRAAAVVGGST